MVTDAVHSRLDVPVRINYMLTNQCSLKIPELTHVDCQRSPPLSSTVSSLLRSNSLPVNSLCERKHLKKKPDVSLSAWIVWFIPYLVGQTWSFALLCHCARSGFVRFTHQCVKHAHGCFGKTWADSLSWSPALCSRWDWLLGGWIAETYAGCVEHTSLSRPVVWEILD